MAPDNEKFDFDVLHMLVLTQDKHQQGKLVVKLVDLIKKKGPRNNDLLEKLAELGAHGVENIIFIDHRLRINAEGRVVKAMAG